MITILPATAEHVLELRANLREEDASEICKFGLPIRRALYRSWRNAIFSRTALVNGEVAAIWGMSGQLLGDKGHPWLLTSSLVEKVPLQFALCYRQQIREMLGHFDLLENYVDSDYDKSIRMLELIGFTVDESNPIQHLKSQAMFRRFWIRRK